MSLLVLFALLFVSAPDGGTATESSSVLSAFHRVDSQGAPTSSSAATSRAVSAAAPISPKPRTTCTVINGVSAYLGCEVTEGGETTMYYNCTNNPPPCMDKADCVACNPPGD